MKFTRRIDDLGRIVIPREMRDEGGIESGDALELIPHEDGILLKPYDCSEGYISRLNRLRADICASYAVLPTEAIKHIDEAIASLKAHDARKK